jgi:PAS domain S-box-containing protein
MPFVTPNRVDPFVLGLALLNDDGVVTWANAAWRNLANTGKALAAQDASQLEQSSLDAAGGDEHAGALLSGLRPLLAHEREDFAIDCRDADRDGLSQWLALYGLRTKDDHVAMVCSADLVDHDTPGTNAGTSRSAAGAWEWDRNSSTITCTEALLSALGLTREDAPRNVDAALALVDPQGRPHALRAAAAARLSGVFDADICIAVAGFRPRYFRVHGEATAWKMGLPSRLIGFAYDVTDVRSGADRLEELARYNEVVADLGRAALSNVNIPPLLHDVCKAAVDAMPFCAFRVVEVDALHKPVTRAEYRLASSDLSAHDDYVVRALRDEALQVAVNVVASAWHSGIAVPLRGESMVLHAVARQPARFGDAEAAFIRAIANVLAAALSRRRYEGDLIAARIEMTALVDHSPDLVLRFDRDLRIVYVNPAVERLTHRKPQQMIGFLISELAHGREEIAAQWESGLRRVLDLGIEHEFEAEGMTSGRNFNVRCVPEPNIDGAILYLLAVCRDVTEKRRDDEEKRRLEQQLEQASRLTSLGRLAATIAHEFNNVLMAIQPFADLLQRRAAVVADPTVDSAAIHITQAVQRGRRITQEMLRYTRAVEPVRDAVEVSELLTYVCNSMRLVVAETLHIALDLPATPVYLHADRTQLEQVFTNLIANARDAVDRGGSLLISAQMPPPGVVYPFGVIPHVEEFLHLTFRDNGTGIPPELMEHIFEPLFTSKRSGTGVGLAVAHQVVSTHGGHLFVESQQGVGTAFHLFLPRAHGVPGMRVEATARHEVRLMRIVLVEDEPAIAEGLSAVLRSEGFEVAHVDTGGAAVPLIESFEPELVLLDVGLPDIDGVEVYRRIHERWPDLPVIFSTGHGDRRKVEEVARDRRVGFLMKPYEVEELFAAIADLENRPAVI